MDWRTLLRENITEAEQLRVPLGLSDEKVRRIREEAEMFPMSVSRYYLSLIDPSDPDDPIRKMAVPSGHLALTDGVLDTSGEHSNTKHKGLQHKYEQTALILTTSACAMYCRHCFRRRLVGVGDEEIADNIGEAVKYLREHPKISNVLLSGGDSFLMSNVQIEAWLKELTALPQLDFIRFGTRTPVTFPQRILYDPELVELLKRYGSEKQIYVVTHFNHPRELTEESVAAVRELQSAGIVVKNQTVLLKGVNDDPQVLGKLLRDVSAIGIVQHYIFQCRPVKGVKSNFQVPLRKGSRIVQAALAMQNGLGKTADYTMSHVTGKIRILGETGDGRMLFQYKQAKNPADIGRIFAMDVDEELTWPEEIIAGIS